jgi:hypothetical protein
MFAVALPRPPIARFDSMRRLTNTRNLLSLWLLPWIALAGGCRLLEPTESAQGRSPLHSPRQSRDSVALEIIWARFSAEDAELTDAMWQEIDETQLAPEVRRELAHNGFRVGVVGGTLPDAIARLFVPDANAEQSPPTAADEADTKLGEFMAEPTVRRRLLQLRRGRRAEIQASEVYPEMPLLVHRGRELVGDVYRDAQAVFGLRVDPQPDQTAIVELTPELHHGSASLRWTSEDMGMLRQAPQRDREIFLPLRLSVPLAPGEMLILTSLPDAGSRLGHYFHTVDSADGPQQKLVLVRLAQVPASDTFDPGGEP